MIWKWVHPVSIDEQLTVLGHFTNGYSMKEKYREAMPLEVLEVSFSQSSNNPDCILSFNESILPMIVHYSHKGFQI